MPRNRLARGLVAVAAIPALAAGAFVGNLYLTQESLLFPGTRLPPDHEFYFAVPFEELTIAVHGAELNALHFRQKEPRGLIFFLHGNGGNLQSWTSNVEYYRRVNYDMFMLDYRGYGKSTGSIESEAQLHADVRRAWDAVAPRYEGKPIVIYGRSLGTALAAKLAREVHPDLLILVSPFRSMLAMGREQYPWLPDRVLRYPLRTDQWLADTPVPTLLVHGDRDRFIVPGHSRELLELAGPQAELLLIEGAGHNDIHHFEHYTESLTKALPN